MDNEGTFFSAVIDAAPDAMLVIDGEGTITFANRQATEMFGIARDELVGSSVDELLPDELRPAHRAHRLRYRAEPKARPMGMGMLLRARRGDGTELPVEVSLSPVPAGETFLVVAAIRDVSARVAADESMREVLLTLDATADAVFILDAQTLRFSYVNDGASRQVGYPRDELLGMTPMHINPELSEAEIRKVVDDVLNGAHALSIRTTHRGQDGTDVPVEMSLQASPQSHRGSLAIIAVARDISARLEAEEQRRRTDEALRQADQAIAIADDRERIARDLHDTVIQRLFASGLALQAITTRVDEEIAGRLDSVVADLDQTIREIRTAIFALQTSTTSEAGFRARILQIVREATDSLGFEPRLTFDGAVETTDDEIAEQLLPTLREALTNIAKHAQAGSVRVSVHVDERRVELAVVDDGAGLSGGMSSGHGVRNMTTRAERLGGTVSLETVQPAGVKLVWSVPLPQA